MQQIPSYRNINATVRTPRCVILIDENSSHWAAAASGAIACASEIWGGRYFAIIPTDGERINAKFWEVLEAYNPDHIVTYLTTVADLETARPDEYAAIKTRSREQWDSSGFGAEFDIWFAKQAEVSFMDRLAISESLQAELIARLSPFHFQGKAAQQQISRRSGFGYPLTKLTEIVSLAASPLSSIVVPSPIDDPAIALLVHSQTGNAGQEFCDKLNKQGLVTIPLPDDVSLSDLVHRVFGGHPLMFAGPNDLPDDLIRRTPFAASMLHLGQYYDSRLHLEYKEPVVVVLGDTVDDFCLYYSLSRLHERVFWLPLAWLRVSYRQHNANLKRHSQGQPIGEFDARQRIVYTMMNLFLENIEYGRSEKRIELRSMSLSVRQLAAYRRQMIACSYTGADELGSSIDCVPIEQTSTTCVLRVFNEDNYVNNESAVFIDGTSVSPFETPKPKGFTEIRPTGHYWLTSLQIEGYRPPPLASLASDIVSIHDSPTETRIASDGIAYHCPNIAYFGSGIDAILFRPKISLPSEMALLQGFFGNMGVTIKYSDKGNYFIDTLERFGGLEAAGTFIKAAGTRSILDKYTSSENAPDGSVIYLNNDQRAYLNFRAFEASLGNDRGAALLIDELVGRSVLERGYIFHCERCLLSSWYSVDVLTSTFTCGRCRFSQQYTLSRWKQPLEPHWYYRLAETIYQFYKSRSDLTAQVLYELKSQSTSAFHYVPEIDLCGYPRPEEKREIDIACVADGKIIVGECKTEPLRPRHITKLSELLKNLDRQPDRIVFATSQPSVTGAFSSQLASVPRAEVLMFKDLYDT